MKNAMTKSTLREIKGSFSRWIAILAICALGVGFFCGLKICKEDFILTGDTFYAQHNFYDYELMSTLGLEKKDVTKMQALDGIAKARGSYSADALFLLTDKKETQTQKPAKRLPSCTRCFPISIPPRSKPEICRTNRINASVTRAISARTISAKKSSSPTTTSRIRKTCSPMIHTNWSASASLRST